MKVDRQPEVFVYLFTLLVGLSQIVEALKLKHLVHFAGLITQAYNP